ncbi:uncharacterized protein LOC128200490 [Galleria mellonella]|uniref:Uncharacterized protein LOC128200490 n=1 Tax=Galleria mellonella TaxID=7137 RepID=A0ABM3MF66_GALME|nr:uncharacterized protein LOC128200490 [Galleria mellonella]
MFSRLQALFRSVENKGDLLSHNSVCEENSLTTVSTSDSSSEQNVEIEDKSTPLVQTSLEAIDEGHAAQCSYPNCDKVLSRFSECNICMEPLQCRGPCVCPSCGNVWCRKCSRRMHQCAWCRFSFEKPITRCLALQRLINDLMLPCRNYSRGCTDLLSGTTRAEHEEDCKFDTIMCPVTKNCCCIPFEKLSEHIQSTHDITAIYSEKIKVAIKNFCTKVKESGRREITYKYILLLHKCAFTVKISFFNYRFEVDVMGKRLGYIANQKFKSSKSEYLAKIEFHTQSASIKTFKLIEEKTYNRNTNLQLDSTSLHLKMGELVTIRVSIKKITVEFSSSDFARSLDAL